MKTTNTLRYSLSSMLALSAAFTLPNTLRAADHGDGTSASVDRSADIGDVYFFRDPVDSTKVVLIGTIQGFIVPSEAGNFGIFDPNVRCRFDIENTGDALFDRSIDVIFSPRAATNAQTAQTQIATIAFNGFGPTPLTRLEAIRNLLRPVPPLVFTAPATNPTLANTPNTQVVTTLGNGVQFFAGITDDPFFFDIVGFNRFVAAVVGSQPNPGSHLARGRDSFAGYNTMTIALSIPVASLRNTGSTTNQFGVSFSTARRALETPLPDGTTFASGEWRQIDRAGVPAVNVALVPFVQKNRYNASNPTVDKSGFFAPGIVGTLQALGASQNAIGTLASVAVSNGDILRIDVGQASAFPNGRRLQDDVIDTILGIIAGGPLGDNVNANELNGGAFGTAFPYILPPHQPLPNGTLDDRTRN